MSGRRTCAVFLEEVTGEALGAVPPVVAVGPRKVARHRREEVVDGPGDDDVVVQRDDRGGCNHGVAHSCTI